jgi:hypothetical protein
MKTYLKYFKPMEDITAYELAQIYANVAVAGTGSSIPLRHRAVEFSDVDWAALPESIQRHWQD